MKIINLLVVLFLLFTSCKTTKEVTKNTEEQQSVKVEEPSKELNLVGLLKQQGMTTYQYGTHVLKTDKKTYALRSKDIDLNAYLEKQVEILGEKIDGYPISGGPEYIKVISIKEKK